MLMLRSVSRAAMFSTEWPHLIRRPGPGEIGAADIGLVLAMCLGRSLNASLVARPLARASVGGRNTGGGLPGFGHKSGLLERHQRKCRCVLGFEIQGTGHARGAAGGRIGP